MGDERAMTDATCPKCRHRFGWPGPYIARPPCPRCGHQLARAEIEKDDAEIEKHRAIAANKGPYTASGKTEAVVVWDYEPGQYVYVGRKHPRFPEEDGLYGNPFGVGSRSREVVPVGSVAEAVDLYTRWLDGSLNVAAMLPPEEVERRGRILASLPNLRGKRLGCFRHPPPCHATVLCVFADSPLGDRRYEEIREEAVRQAEDMAEMLRRLKIKP